MFCLFCQIRFIDIAGFGSPRQVDLSGDSMYLITPMKREIQIGDFRCLLLKGGSLRVDGGAMFGVVPRILWEKKIGGVRKNCVDLPVNPLLIIGPQHRILIDPGIGPREAKRFGRDYHVRSGESLTDQLHRAGVTPEEIDIVINTHLHWDHSGANLKFLPDGTVVPAYPKAVYLVQGGEWESALSPNELTKEGYLLQADPTLVRSGQLELLHGSMEIVPGITLMMTPGHTPFHQSVLVQSEGETILYTGDLIPTAAHLPQTYISAFDLEPLRTFETKKRLLRQAREEGWTLAFCHEGGDALFHKLRNVNRTGS